MASAVHELDKGVLDERRAELAEHRRQRMLRERHEILNKQLVELREGLFDMKMDHGEAKTRLKKEEEVKKQHQWNDLEERKRTGNYHLPLR